MNILIIEDEVKSAKALAQLIKTVQPGAHMVASIQSVAGAVSYLSDNVPPDVIFMDIQLADGLCFEIFKDVKIVSPIIFCTAYNDYAIEAFKSNGIDYILKPFSKDTIAAAFDKVKGLKNFFQTNELPINGIDELLNKVSEDQGKKSFLVFKHNKYTIVPTDRIAFFYINNESPTIMTLDKQEFAITQSLDEVSGLLSAKQFYRLNRQYLINFSAIKEVEHYFARKLFVRLTFDTAEKLLVGKDKVTHFLNWLENR